MIDRAALLSDLQSLLKRLEADLLERSESSDIPEVGQTLRAEFARAQKAERTAQNYEDWRTDAITQVAAAWVLSCVFVRFLEDNGLIDPKIAGPDRRLQQARDQHEEYFTAHPTETDREYLLSVFNDLAQHRGVKDVFGEHNPMRQLPAWLSGDAAGELLTFFQKIEPATGVLIHDFTDPQWDTRFLGDLYQDLSEAVRKKYALLQTPDFVEEFILDRTLEPALDEFGLEQELAAPEQSELPEMEDRSRLRSNFRMIDPACGSGHFLLGAFPRILDRWQRKEPGGKVRELVRKTLDCIHGVDVNPYAVAIARFRLLMVALKACEITRLVDSPPYDFNVACGDSLLHGINEQQSFGWRDTDHTTFAEDEKLLRKILSPDTYHTVVANPPYITVKDKATNKAYRDRYATCHRQYSLAVPFMERIFQLAVRSGYTGQITANSFMKREFGKKLIEDFLHDVDLTHIIDTSGADIPGCGTPTVIIFARCQKRISSTIRTAMGVRGEPSTPENPAKGLVWTAITSQINLPDAENDFISVADSPADLFSSHPWSMGGGGATELKTIIEEKADKKLQAVITEIGASVVTREDEVYQIGRSVARRLRLANNQIRPMIDGENVRDWSYSSYEYGFWPYDPLTLDPELDIAGVQYMWSYRTGLAERVAFGKTQIEHGKTWFEYSMLFKNRLEGELRISQSEVATNNHFALDYGGKIFNRTAPVIKLLPDATVNDHFALLGLLNSSTACFWMKQVCFPKKGFRDDKWEERFAFNATQLSALPIPTAGPTSRSSLLVSRQQENVDNLRPSALIGQGLIDKQLLKSRLKLYVEERQQMISDQEELDWECYNLYDLISAGPRPSESAPPIKLGQRAFEIVMARKMAVGKLETTWFERHGSTPITELPDDWPADYKRLVEQRIELIENDRNIGLIEQPEYKRRWNTEPWESQLERACRQWLLDRLESYFDFDGRMNDAGEPTAKLEIGVTSVAKLADVAGRDKEFMEVGELYRDDKAFDVQKLVAELVAAEHVPLLPALRYKPPGLRKRLEWERTWELQRAEDAIDARTQLPADDPQHLTEDQACDLKQQEVGDIAVPPKYKSSDFISSGGARYWALRGKLDVPKERWVSFPRCEGPDGTLPIAWAGYDHLQLARAISAYFVDIQEHHGGRDDPRLIPLLACIIELLPWLKQWHHEIDPEYNQRMDEVFEGFVTEESRNLGKTVEEIKAWEPPKKTARRKRRRAES